MSLNDYKNREAIIAKRGYRDNIAGDKFSLYIASYPKEIEYVASRIGDPEKKLIEFCCGIGIGLEIFSNYFKEVIGVDNDPQILNDCKINLSNSSHNNYTLLNIDITDEKSISKLEADIIVYDVPFWSPYSDKEKTTISTKNPDFKKTIDSFRKITEDIVIYTSPEYTYGYLEELVGLVKLKQFF